MTRRERLERKLEKRREWAESRERKAAHDFQASRDATKGIEFGQPILVGHHSERRHRAAVDRSWNLLGRAVENSDMAAHHNNKADGLESQLDGSIFSDDPDALEQIAARVAELEAKRESWKKANADHKRAGTGGESPYQPYSFSNLGANIRRLKKRAEQIKHRQELTAKAEAAPGGVLIVGTDYINVRFAEKPARSILDELKAAGFHWSGGAWCGYREKLPASVLALTT